MPARLLCIMSTRNLICFSADYWFLKLKVQANWKDISIGNQRELYLWMVFPNESQIELVLSWLKLYKELSTTQTNLGKHLYTHQVHLNKENHNVISEQFLKVSYCTCAMCGRQRWLDRIRFTLGVGVTNSPASSISEWADTMLCNMDNAASPVCTSNQSIRTPCN